MSRKHQRQSRHRHHAGDARPAGLPPLIAALLEPGLYPHPAPDVSLVETHISWLLLAGDYAYKIKKPVNLGFLDFTSLEKRHFFCNEEVRLNRRTAPGIYLDAIPVTGSETAPKLGGNGTAIEYAVRMRRFSQDALLDNLARHGKLQRKHIEALASILARFHDAVERARPEDPAVAARAVLAPALQNFEQVCTMLTHGPGWAALESLREWTLGEFASLEQVFEARARDGYIRECHGDLHLGNVALINGEPVPFDCIEFNTAFRWIDVMNEVAFMMMDLLDHGMQGMAYAFLNRYLELTGDYNGLRVLRFYLVYRAMVRAKVALIRAHQSADEKAEADFVHHVALANSVCACGRPALVLMHGVSGSGKSTVARMLQERLGAVRVRSDVERKRLCGLSAAARSGSPLGGGIYSSGATAITYQRLAGHASAILAAGYPTIVDATSLKREQRDVFRRLAADAGVPFAVVSCEAPQEVLCRRVVERAQEGTDPSEAGLTVLESQCSGQEALTADELAQTIAVDTRQDDNNFDQTLSLLAQRLGLKAFPAQ